MIRLSIKRVINMSTWFRYFATCLFSLSCLLSITTQAASFDLLNSSPLGSWQIRETIDTNHKGKKSGTRVKTSMVGKEQRNGQTHYWIEVNVENFKIKKNGQRKAKGKPVFIKSLVPAEVLKGDPENAISNLRAFGVETIIQNGNQRPMKIDNSNGLIAGAMKAAKVEVKHDYQSVGEETITVAAGEFNVRKLQGAGSASANLVIKKIKIDSDSTVWVSSKVPFGLVKADATTLTNGKTSTQKTELLEFGLRGAVSAITQTPQKMPSITNPFGQ